MSTSYSYNNWSLDTPYDVNLLNTYESFRYRRFIGKDHDGEHVVWVSNECKFHEMLIEANNNSITGLRYEALATS